MRAGISAAIIAAAALFSGTAWSACLPGKSRNCVVNLNLAPQISQQIVTREHLVAAPKAMPAAEPIPPYTGPTVGFDPMLRRAPTVGYRWAIN